MEPGLNNLFVLFLSVPPELRKEKSLIPRDVNGKKGCCYCYLIWGFSYMTIVFCFISTSPSPPPTFPVSSPLPDKFMILLEEMFLKVGLQLPECGFLRTNMGIPLTLRTKACDSKACHDRNMGYFRSVMIDNVVSNDLHFGGMNGDTDTCFSQKYHETYY